MFEELEMNPVSLYIVLADKEREKLIRHELKAKWGKVSSANCNVSFSADPVGFSCRRTCCSNKKNMTSESLESSNRSSNVQSCYVFVAKRIAAMMFARTKLLLKVKSSTNVCWNRGVKYQNEKERQQGEVSEHTITLLEHKNKIRKGFLTFIRKKRWNCWNSHSNSQFVI